MSSPGLETTFWTPLSGAAGVLLRFGQFSDSPQPREALAPASFGHALDHLSPFHSPASHPQPTRPRSNHDPRSPTLCFILDQMLCLFSYPSWPLPGAVPSSQSTTLPTMPPALGQSPIPPSQLFQPSPSHPPHLNGVREILFILLWVRGQ